MLKKALLAVALVAVTASPAASDFILKGQFRAPCRGVPPAPPEWAQQEPNVPYEVVVWPQSKVHRKCANGRTTHQPITACAVPLPSGWLIVMSSFLSPEDYACVLLYEKAHLPPNSWIDKAWEDQGFKGTPYEGKIDAPYHP